MLPMPAPGSPGTSPGRSSLAVDMGVNFRTFVSFGLGRFRGRSLLSRPKGSERESDDSPWPSTKDRHPADRQDGDSKEFRRTHRDEREGSLSRRRNELQERIRPIQTKKSETSHGNQAKPCPGNEGILSFRTGPGGRRTVCSCHRWVNTSPKTPLGLLSDYC
jgi:hypothetical protein